VCTNTMCSARCHCLYQQGRHVRAARVIQAVLLWNVSVDRRCMDWQARVTYQMAGAISYEQYGRCVLLQMLAMSPSSFPASPHWSYAFPVLPLGRGRGEHRGNMPDR
jgi:hypothetical protein